VNVPGPTLLLPRGAGEEDVSLAAQICAAYGDHGDKDEVIVRIARGTQSEERRVVPLPRERLTEWMMM